MTKHVPATSETTGTPRSSETAVPPGFYYIPQDNYYIANLEHPNLEKPERYLYSDSATSCVIMVVTGQDRHNSPIVVLAHLSHNIRFQQFFLIVEEHFVGPVAVYAQGANPPALAPGQEHYPNASLQNTHTIARWLQKYIAPRTRRNDRSWYIHQCTLALGQGLPTDNDRDCYGVDLTTLTVSNQRFTLTPLQRDPTEGVQTLFSIFGQDVTPPLALHQVDVPFTEQEIEQLVQTARAHHWTRLLSMTDKEILTQLSTTPQYEVPWFVETLRQSARFVRDYG